jgi:hypothetical protein
MSIGVPLADFVGDGKPMIITSLDMMMEFVLAVVSGNTFVEEYSDG